MVVVKATTAMGGEPRGQRIFDGELIVFRALDAMRLLVARADTMIRAAFTPHDPLTAHTKLAPAAYADIAEGPIAAFAKDAGVADSYQAALVAAGVDPGRVYWDRLRLRIQPPGDSHMSRRVVNLAPHRDTWGSNVLAQHNWWAPIYPITAKRTLILYPAHWRQAIANTSGDWDYHELLTRRQAGDDSYPLLPVATGRVDDGNAWPCDINPGDLLCFSGAHLHASVPNTTPQTRFSTEVRTVCLDDLRHGCGAPNVDGTAPRQPLEWFNRMADGAPLVST